MSSQSTKCSNNKISVSDYIEEHLKIKDNLYVPNIQNCDENEVEYILLVESPHKSELNSNPKLPLMGNSGINVSKFLIGKDCEKPIGQIVYDRDIKQIHGKKIAIVNVCNIPLQIIDDKNDFVCEKDLKHFRDTFDNTDTNEVLKNNLIETISKYKYAKKIILCGNFAQKYYDSIKKENKIKTLRLKPLYVPHPSYSNWVVVYNHKKDISKLKKLFK